MGVPNQGPKSGSQIGVPNRGHKLGSQIGVPNRGPKLGSQIGVPNRGPKSGSQIGVLNWGPKSRSKSGSQIRVPNRGPKLGPKLGSQIRIPKSVLICDKRILSIFFRSESEMGFSKSQIFGLGLQRSPRTRTWTSEKLCILGHESQFDHIHCFCDPR
jgi:hypothetical protein